MKRSIPSKLKGTVMVAALAVAACTSDGEDPGDPLEAGPTAAVSMRDNSFSPATARVLVGGVVTWTNNGSVQHNTTRSQTPDTWQSSNLNPNQTFQRTFSTAGTFDYSCTLHPGMNGRIIVEAN
jgi:plastocyanin